MDNKSKDFKTLQDEWYKKLKDEGFKDHETNEKHLKWSTASRIKQNLSKEKEVANLVKENYFRLVGYFLYEHEFTNKTEKLVWAHHAEGRSMRDTSAALSKVGINMATTQVKETIHRVRLKMFKKYRELGNE